MMINNSIRWSLAGNEVDWITKTSAPRTFSWISTKISMSAKRRTTALVSGVPIWVPIPCASAGLELPATSLMAPLLLAISLSWSPLFSGAAVLDDPADGGISGGTMCKNTALIQAASGAGNPNQGLVPAGFFALLRASDTIATASKRGLRPARSRRSVWRIFYRSQLRVSSGGTARRQIGVMRRLHAVSAHRLDRIHRTPSAARIAQARLPAARAAASSDDAPDQHRKRGDRRYRAAAKHGGGAAGRRCGHSLRRPGPRDVRHPRRRLPGDQHRSDHQPRARREARRRQALHLSVFDPRPVRAERRRCADRGARSAPDRCLWALEACRRARPRRARPRLGRVASDAGLRAGREGQHGGADAACASAMAVAARRPAGAALAAGGGKFVGGGGNRPDDA